MKKIQIPEWVPLFPLPNVVFFPKTYLPLHVFEPRYREMVQDTMEGDRIIGMALLKEGWEIDYDRNPPIHSIGSIGEIVRSQRQDDGRYNILLYGLKKYRVREENFLRSYRQARIEIIEESEINVLPAAIKERLVEQMMRYGRKMPGGDALESILEMGLDDDVLVATLSAGLPLTILEKQFLLESEDLHQRARRLVELMEMGFQTIEQAGGQMED